MNRYRTNTYKHYSVCSIVQMCTKAISWMVTNIVNGFCKNLQKFIDFFFAKILTNIRGCGFALMCTDILQMWRLIFHLYFFSYLFECYTALKGNRTSISRWMRDSPVQNLSQILSGESFLPISVTFFSKMWRKINQKKKLKKQLRQRIKDLLRCHYCRKMFKLFLPNF